MDSSPAPRLRLQIITFAVIRTITNTGWRMVYPFLPAIARGLGVELALVARAVTARSLLGLLAPLFGSTADTWGRRTALVIGMVIFSAGMLLVVVWPTYPALLIALILSGIGKFIFDPATQAFIGDRIDYQQRGLVIALTEMSWSGAFVIGIPLVGWLIARSGWRAPFPWLALLGLAAGLVLWRMLPLDAPHPDERPSLAAGMRTVLTHPSALGGLAVSLLVCAANETVNIMYGAWMEDAFAIQVAALGAASTVIGVAELAGEGFVAALVDRIGKRRAVALGVTLNALACLALPFLGANLVGALIGLFCFYITFEVTIVSSLPLMTELVPGARATMMAGNVAAISLGRVLGALIGPGLFAVGLLGNGIAAAAFNALAVVILLAVVKQE